MSVPDGYRYLRHRGHGYFAEVLECVDVNTGRPVALKRLRSMHAGDAACAVRFAREIEITRALAGVPGVAVILSNGVHEDRAYYTMDLAAEDLHGYITRANARLLPERRAAFCAVVIGAVAEAHDRGMLHRDVSPQNVLVYGTDPDVDLRVADFGLGKTLGELQSLTGASVAGYGSPLYVAPEQRQSLQDASPKSDVFSLGRLVDFIMTGRDPDNAGSHVLSTVSRCATMIEPDRRYGTAREMHQAFRSQQNLVFGSVGAVLHAPIDLDALREPITDWAGVHRVVTTGNYQGRSYYGYVEPVLRFLSDRDRLDRYASAIGAAIDDAAMRIANEIDQCARETGWPFDASDGFYPALHSLNVRCHGLAAKRRCFAVVWLDAYTRDRWAAQRTVKRMLGDRTMSLPEQAELAAAILEIGADKVDDSLLEAVQPGPLRNAIRTLPGRAH